MTKCLNETISNYYQFFKMLLVLKASQSILFPINFCSYKTSWKKYQYNTYITCLSLCNTMVKFNISFQISVLVRYYNKSFFLFLVLEILYIPLTQDLVKCLEQRLNYFSLIKTSDVQPILLWPPPALCSLTPRTRSAARCPIVMG